MIVNHFVIFIIILIGVQEIKPSDLVSSNDKEDNTLEGSTN